MCDIMFVLVPARMEEELKVQLPLVFCVLTAKPANRIEGAVRIADACP